MIRPLSPQQAKKLQSDIIHETSLNVMKTSGVKVTFFSMLSAENTRPMSEALTSWRDIFIKWKDHAIPYFCGGMKDVLALMNKHSPNLVTRFMEVTKIAYRLVPCDTPIPAFLFQLAEKVYHQEYQFPNLISNRDHKAFIKLFNEFIQTKTLPSDWRSRFLLPTPWADILSDLQNNIRGVKPLEKCPQCSSPAMTRLGGFAFWHLTPNDTLCSLHGQVPTKK